MPKRRQSKRQTILQSRSTNFSGSNIVNAFSAVAKKAIRKIKQVVGDMPSGISLHRLVVTLPVGVFCVVVFLDFFALVSWSESWALASFYTLGLGLIFALCALLTGLVAASKLGKESELRRAAFLHGLPMLIASLLFTFCWVGRLSEPSAISIWWFGLNLIAVFVLFYGLCKKLK